MKFLDNALLKIVLLFIWFYKVANLEEINFPDNSSWNGIIQNKSDVKQYKVNISEINSIKFLKILINGENDTLIHYALSFYQNDSSFTKRYQLFQSYNREIEIWLNNDQFNNDFYFSIECDKYPCSYDGYINITNNIELNFNKIYNYYVTSETKEMDFTFKINNISNNTKDSLLIWAKGNKNVNVIDETINSTENNEKIIKEDICTNIKDINTRDTITEKIEKKYQYYFLKLSDYNQSEIYYNLKVNGELGDIINVGSIIFNEDGNSTFIFEDNVEISGLVKNEYMKTICFQHNGNKSLTFTNHNYVKFNYTEDDKSFCLTLQDEREGFFSFYYVNTDNKNESDLYYPKVIGIEQPMRYIKENNSIQIIIKKPSDYFDYFIYNFNTPNNIFIEGYFCDSYPFCNISDSESMKKIELYESFKDITFLKNNHSLSLIDKNQLILIIRCINADVKKEDEIPDNIGYKISHYCLTDINIYKEIYYSQYVYRNESKDDEYTFIYDYSFSYFFLNIELFYGEISIKILEPSSEQYVSFYNKNRYLYEIQNSFCRLIIKTNINTYYHISYTPLIMTIKNNGNFISQTYFTYLYNVEGTYLLHFDEYYNSFSDMFFENNLTNLTKPLLPLSIDSNEDLLLINFNPINCEIEFSNSSQTNITKIFDSYQSLNILNYNNSTQSFHYSVKKKEEKEECLFLVSVYNLNSSNSSIILSRNVPRLFNFPSKLTSMNFSYYHQRKNLKYIIISLEPFNGSFDVVFLFNDVSLNSTNNNREDIKARREIKIQTDNITDDLEDSNCYKRYLIKFQVISKSDGNSNLRINVLYGNDDLKNFMIIYNSVIFLIFISLVLFFLFILYRKRKPKFKKEKSYLIELEGGKGEVRGNNNEAILNSINSNSEL